MTSAYDSKSIRQSGEIVMSALRVINEPSTLTNIIKYLSEVQQLEPSQIKEPVKKVLKKAVEFGFVKKQGAKYCIDAPEDEQEDEQDSETGFGELEDRASRRRRRPRSTRSKSRSRSRSKRRASKRGRR